MNVAALVEFIETTSKSQNVLIFKGKSYFLMREFSHKGEFNVIEIDCRILEYVKL